MDLFHQFCGTSCEFHLRARNIHRAAMTVTNLCNGTGRAQQDALNLFDVDERQTEFRFFLPDQMGWRFRQRNFQRGANIAFDQMAATGRTV